MSRQPRNSAALALRQSHLIKLKEPEEGARTGVQGRGRACGATCRTQSTQSVRGVGREHVAHVIDAIRALVGARHARDVLRYRASMRSQAPSH